MVNVVINNTPAKVPEGTTIMEAAKSIGIDIPHLCYLKDVNEIGACRVCSVEVEGEDRLVPSCDNVVKEGMVITTNSSRVRNALRTNLSLILSQHKGNCTSCVRSGNCQLQTLANTYNVNFEEFDDDLRRTNTKPWSKDFPFIRDAGKCIKCMRCIQICDKVQGMGIWDLLGTGSRSTVGVAKKQDIEKTDCTHCSQCVTHCPVGALYERDDIDKAMGALENPDIVTVVSIAPAVRTAYAEQLGLSHEEATVSRLAGALKQIGFDYVFDTSFTADLTIMEEGNEFLKRFKGGELAEFPMFTSCCPGWVRFIKSQYPDMVKQLSTAKSPQQMMGAVIKNYWAKKMDIDPAKICNISIMPCVAKKGEANIPNMENKDGLRDIDIVLTTREVARLINQERINIADVKEVPFDTVLGEYTGAGVIFGATGGVMEAALRSCSYILTGKNPDADAFMEVQAKFADKNKPWRELEYNLAGIPVRVAITSGLANTRKLMDAIIRKETKLDFVEIMACPGGCAGGGGQPIHCDDIERFEERGEVLYSLDKNSDLRFSHENKDVLALYSDWLKEPVGEVSEEFLHTEHII